MPLDRELIALEDLTLGSRSTRVHWIPPGPEREHLGKPKAAAPFQSPLQKLEVASARSDAVRANLTSISENQYLKPKE